MKLKLLITALFTLLFANASIADIKPVGAIIAEVCAHSQNGAQIPENGYVIRVCFVKVNNPQNDRALSAWNENAMFSITETLPIFAGGGTSTSYYVATKVENTESTEKFKYQLQYRHVEPTAEGSPYMKPVVIDELKYEHEFFVSQVQPFGSVDIPAVGFGAAFKIPLSSLTLGAQPQK